VTIAAAVAVVVLFGVLIHALHVIPRTKTIIDTSRNVIATVNNRTLSDDEKENLLQTSAKNLLVLLFILIVTSAISALAPLAVVWLFETFGLLSLQSVIETLLRWDFMVVMTVLTIAVYLAIRALHR